MFSRSGAVTQPRRGSLGRCRYFAGHPRRRLMILPVSVYQAGYITTSHPVLYLQPIIRYIIVSKIKNIYFHLFPGDRWSHAAIEKMGSFTS